mmetsp:Transcript_34606/g.87549  ORF Transcript_34606/g.87549 Transcript_34606/m.87549 type:complete len:207 (-) Transcript_34606:257-877(-)
MISPDTRCSSTADMSSTISLLSNDASVTEARASRKSPAKIAVLLPMISFTDATPLRVTASSSTSSCSRDATWISSAISATRCCLRLGSGARTLAGLLSTPRQSKGGGSEERALAMSMMSVGRRRLPSTPGLKKYSAALRSTGMVLVTLCLRRSDMDPTSVCTMLKGSTLTCDALLLLRLLVLGSSHACCSCGITAVCSQLRLLPTL